MIVLWKERDRAWTMTPAHYLFDHIHNTAEKLYTKQSLLRNENLFQHPNREVIDLQIHWTPGHMNSNQTKEQTNLPKQHLKAFPAHQISCPNTFTPSRSHTVSQPYAKLTSQPSARNGKEDGKPLPVSPYSDPLTSLFLLTSF